MTYCMSNVVESRPKGRLAFKNIFEMTSAKDPKSMRTQYSRFCWDEELSALKQTSFDSLKNLVRMWQTQAW